MMRSRIAESPQWEYVAAAAVLTDFAAEELRPLSGEKPKIAEVGAMLLEHGQVIKTGPAKGRWRLTEVARRGALSELWRQKRIEEVLDRSPGGDNPVQQAMRQLVSDGKRPSLDGMSLRDLLGLQIALDWCGPFFGGEDSDGYAGRLKSRIRKMRLLDPLQILIADGFAGRDDKLGVLREYVDELPPQSFLERVRRGFRGVLDVFRERPPLVIHGPGGVGKSTLIAKFISDHTGSGQAKPIPFIYLDFDNGSLDPNRPDSLVAEAFRQIRIQYPELASESALWESATHARLSSEDMVEVAKSSHYGRSSDLREELADVLRRIIEANDQNLLLVIDTFEVVQRRGLTAQFNVLELAAELLTAARRLRIVIAGRAPLRVEDFESVTTSPPRWRSLSLAGFDKEAARAYLRSRIASLGSENVLDSEIDRIAKLAMGNPLSLRLAAQVFARQGLAGFDDTLGRARFDAGLEQEHLQGMLHRRIVAGLPEKLQAVADPGLVVRRINKGVIREVLAGPCHLDLSEPSAVEDVFELLKSESALVRQVGPDLLRHREDVRVLMLPLLRTKLGDQASAIDEGAVAYWQSQDGPDARAEELYHRIWLQQTEEEWDSCWERGVASGPAEEILDELAALDRDPAARVWLHRKLEKELPPNLEEDAGDAARDRNSELQVRNLLSNGAVVEALSVLRKHSRQSRLAKSALWGLEIDTLKLLGRDEEAMGVWKEAWEAAAAAGAPQHVHNLLMQKVSLLERASKLDEALAAAEEAGTLAKEISDPVLIFSTQVARLRLLRKSGEADLEGPDAESVAEMLDGERLQDALSSRPSLQLEAAAEIGVLRPQLFFDVAKIASGGKFSEPLATDKGYDVASLRRAASDLQTSVDVRIKQKLG